MSKKVFYFAVTIDDDGEPILAQDIEALLRDAVFFLNEEYGELYNHTISDISLVENK